MARPAARERVLREKHREVSAARPAPRRHFDALAEANKLQDDAIRTRIAARGYGAAGYDLLACSPPSRAP